MRCVYITSDLNNVITENCACLHSRARFHALTFRFKIVRIAITPAELKKRVSVSGDLV